MKKYTSQERIDYILDALEHLNHVTLEDFSEKLNVTTQTVRRDVAKLEARKLVVKYHGGILRLAKEVRENYALRQADKLDAKKTLSRLCLNQISDSSSLFLTIGTTLEIFVTDLVSQRVNLKVITNSIKNANALIENTTFHVITPCGDIRNHNGGVVGVEAAEFLKSFRTDCVILSAGGISKDGMVLDYNLDEIQLAKQMIQQAQTSILLMDSSKFHSRANIVLSPLSDIDFLITEKKPPEELIELCQKANCQLVYPA